MELTKGQREALAMVRELSRGVGYRKAILEGYAGTGKTTTIGCLHAELGDKTVGDITILCPTGKAAVRAREVTGLPAQTIHRFLFKPHSVGGKVRFTPKPTSELAKYAGHLLVIDEASMVGPDLWQALESACEAIGDVRVLLVGDGYQLPPVEEGEATGWCALDAPTPLKVRLEEVLRQAAESRVIQAATKLRNGASPTSLVSLLRWVETKDAAREALDAWDRGSAVLVHSNKLRRAVNTMIRKSKGFGTDLQPGEPLLVMQNSYGLDMFNGEISTFSGWTDPPGRYQAEARTRYSPYLMSFGLASVDGTDVLLCSEQVFEEFDNVYVSNKAAEDAADEAWFKVKHSRPAPYLNAVNGYALTGHKAQGSEYDEAFVFVEKSIKLDTEMGRRWIYTCVTRAREAVSLVFCPWDYQL